MDKRFWAVVAAIILIFTGIVIANNRNKEDTSGDSSKASATSHTYGEGAKGVTLVEYGDFQCPVCGLYEPALAQVREKYKDDIKFQFRHFPLQNIHQNAFAASRAAETAGKQNKFWEMHDAIYAGQNDWSNSSNPVSLFTQYAQRIGLNAEQFKNDFSARSVNDAINADIAAGTKLKVSGTPAFFVNGKLIELKDLVGSDNYPTVEKFSQIIDKAIKEQEAKQPAAGTSETPAPAESPESSGN